MNIGHLITAPIASVMAVLTIVATQAMTGHESRIGLVVGYTGGWFLLFGLGASIPKLFNNTARKAALAAFVAFGAGGAVAGGLIAVLLVTHNLGGSAAAAIFALGVPLILPWLLGAAVLFLWRVRP